MSLEGVILQAMRKAAERMVPVLVTEGTVIAVDKLKRICDVSREMLPELFDVRLNTVLEAGNDLLTIYPKKGSKVLCILVENQPTDTFVLSATDIEEISGQIGEMKFTWTKDGIIFNDGKLGGLTNTPELKKQLDFNTSRVDMIINAIKNGIIVAGDGGASFKSSMITTLSTIVSKEDYSNIEDKNVKH